MFDSITFNYRVLEAKLSSDMQSFVSVTFYTLQLTPGIKSTCPGTGANCITCRGFLNTLWWPICLTYTKTYNAFFVQTRRSFYVAVSILGCLS